GRSIATRYATIALSLFCWASSRRSQSSRACRSERPPADGRTGGGHAGDRAERFHGDRSQPVAGRA
ncbi:MAG TPA: hypothetical protein VF225_02900, partial [Gaiellaceae bacterium]